MKPRIRPWSVPPPCTRHPERWRNGAEYIPAHRRTRKADPDTPWLVLLAVLMLAGLVWAAITTS